MSMGKSPEVRAGRPAALAGLGLCSFLRCSTCVDKPQSPRETGTSWSPQMWKGMGHLWAWGQLWMDEMRGGRVETLGWASDLELYPAGPRSQGRFEQRDMEAGCFKARGSLAGEEAGGGRSGGDAEAFLGRLRAGPRIPLHARGPTLLEIPPS